MYWGSDNRHRNLHFNWKKWWKETIYGLANIHCICHNSGSFCSINLYLSKNRDGRCRFQCSYFFTNDRDSIVCLGNRVLSRNTWENEGNYEKGYLFLILSGVATGLSWLCYFAALAMGKVSVVAPIDKFSVVITMILSFILLKEKMTKHTIIGGIIITAGTVLLIL